MIEYIELLKQVVVDNAEPCKHGCLFRRNGKLKNLNNLFYSNRGKPMCHAMFCSKNKGLKERGRYLLCDAHNYDFTFTKQSYLESEFAVEIATSLKYYTLNYHGLTRDEFISVIHNTILRVVDTKDLCKYRILKNGMETCNVVGCAIKTTLREKQGHMLCRAHYNTLYQRNTKQRFILDGYYTTFLNELDKYKDIKSWPKLCKEKQSATHAITLWRKFLSKKVHTPTSTTNISVEPPAVCGRVDCCISNNLLLKYGDVFCGLHAKEIYGIRLFKRALLSLEEEIILRKKELAIRKTKDPKHEWYVRYLERKLLK